jgi:hypothetical protein
MFVMSQALFWVPFSDSDFNRARLDRIKGIMSSTLTIESLPTRQC